jgi:Fanconi-associated nuclease 1
VIFSLWNFEKRSCRFVEVKGPGDILSETQKVWIDVLLSAGVEVELCSVKQIFEEDELDLSDNEPASKRKRSTPAKSKKRQAKGESPDDSEGSEEDEENKPAKASKLSKKSKTASKARDDEDEEEKENIPNKLSKKGTKSKAGDLAKKPAKTDKQRKAGVKKGRGITTSGQTIVLSD